MVTYNQPGIQYNEGRYNAVTVSATGSAQLGALTAVAGATPVPRPVQGAGRPNPYLVPRPRRKKKAEPIVVEAPRMPVRVVAVCVPVAVGFAADALAQVTFVAEEDDLQVLLML